MAKEFKPFGDKRGSGIKLPTNHTIVREVNGQYRITIPKAMALIVELEDRDVIKWSTTGKALVIEKVRKTYQEFQENLEQRKRLKEELQ